MLTGRPLMVASLLGASIGVPYVVSKSHQETPQAATPATASGHWNAGPSPFAAHHPAATYASAPLPTHATPIAATPVPVPSIRYLTIPQVFRFDVTREWIYQNWDRKSTGLADPSMYGVRVPLVTGTGMTDLAGSLTYHFNTQGQVEHVSFRGRTADTTAILQYLVQSYQFQRMDAPAGEQLYQVRSGKSVYSEFRSRPEAVLNANSPHGSFGVVIELGRPGLNRPLVPQTPKLDVPPAAAAPAPANAEQAAKNAGDANASDEPALIGQFRLATPEEQGQVMSRRWPN